MNSLGFDKSEKDTKVVVAMSGGVDRSVAAVKLKKEGYASRTVGVEQNLNCENEASKNNIDLFVGGDIESTLQKGHLNIDIGAGSTPERLQVLGPEQLGEPHALRRCAIGGDVVPSQAQHRSSRPDWVSGRAVSDTALPAHQT